MTRIFNVLWIVFGITFILAVLFMYIHKKNRLQAPHGQIVQPDGTYIVIDVYGRPTYPPNRPVYPPPPPIYSPPPSQATYPPPPNSNEYSPPQSTGNQQEFYRPPEASSTTANSLPPSYQDSTKVNHAK